MPGRRGGSRQQVVDVGVAGVVAEPLVRDLGDRVAQQRPRSLRQRHQLGREAGHERGRSRRRAAAGRRGASCGGTTGRRRGRSARCRRARPAGWGCATTGRRCGSGRRTRSASPANSGSGFQTGGSKPSAPGRKSMARLSPALALRRSWISSSGSRRPSWGSRSITFRSGVAKPRPRASSAQITSATSTRRPCPAPRNLTTWVPRSSASITPGSEPPSRSGVT